MKINLRRILALAIFISVAALNISARTDGGPDRKLSRKERKENDMAKVDKMLSDTVYVVDVTTALPTGWKSVRLSSGYSVEIEKDNVVSSLPYFGRAYSLPYGGGEGLSFEGKSFDYVITPEKKGMREIRFSVRTKEDLFRFHLDVSLDGTVYITVLSNNRQPISFSGHIRMYDE